LFRLLRDHRNEECDDRGNVKKRILSRGNGGKSGTNLTGRAKVAEYGPSVGGGQPIDAEGGSNKFADQERPGKSRALLYSQKREVSQGLKTRLKKKKGKSGNGNVGNGPGEWTEHERGPFV